MFTFSFSQKREAVSPDSAAVEFVRLLIEHAKETFGTLRVKEILRSTFSLREQSVRYGSDGYPLFEEGGSEALQTSVIGLANELARAFGTAFTEEVLRRVIERLESKFPKDVIEKSVLPIVPAGYLESRKIRLLSKEELEREVEKKTFELQSINEQLERKVAERTQALRQFLDEQEKAAQLLVRRDFELTKANERLRKLDEVKSSFISVVAHQLRTPLSGIKWTLNLLLNGDLGELTTEQKTFMFKAYESNDRMIGLVNDMLGADRVESGKMRYAFQPLQLQNVVDSVLFELLPQARARGLILKYAERSDALPKVYADPERIRAVFQNLLENAVKYSRANGAIEIRMAPVGKGMVEVAIKDNGIGIPREQQKDIFSRFFRASNAIKAETEGSGLGLYIVKNIIERHDGDVWFESTEGNGVTFHFTLPVYKEAGQTVSSPAPMPTLPTDPGVVDRL